MVVVGTDLARELFAEYTASLQSRLEFALSVQRSTAYVADAVYERILSGPVAGDALFTAGGTGAGKTTAIRTSSQPKGLISEAVMLIAKDKSVKPSTRRRADVRVVPQISPKRARPVSTERVAEQFCAEMIQNLKHNVPRSKHRLA